MSQRTDFQTAVLTGAALLGFAGNSLLCRLALSPHTVDASTFTTVRLCAGTLTLRALVRLGRSPAVRRGASWTPGLLLFTYAVAFSFAYLRLSVGTGALILFGAVQATMIGWGLRMGERPRPIVWVGLGVALSGLTALTFPGLSAPDPLGAGLMVFAGISWGVYSLLGRNAGDPLASTADNFAHSLPFAALASVVTLSRAHVSTRGVVLAIASGSLASGVGYSFWYAALRELSATRAAIAQLAVPALAALGAVLFLGETLSFRLLAAGALVITGVAISGPSARSTAGLGK
jgi:drug/metabolite transporter (DMT)-like permease